MKKIKKFISWEDLHSFLIHKCIVYERRWQIQSVFVFVDTSIFTWATLQLLCCTAIAVSSHASRLPVLHKAYNIAINFQS